MGASFQKFSQSIADSVQAAGNQNMRMGLEPLFLKAKRNVPGHDVPEVLRTIVNGANAHPVSVDAIGDTLQRWRDVCFWEHYAWILGPLDALFEQSHRKPPLFRVDERSDDLVASVISHGIEHMEELLSVESLPNSILDGLQSVSIVDNNVALAAVEEGFDMMLGLTRHADDRVHPPFAGELHGKGTDRSPSAIDYQWPRVWIVLVCRGRPGERKSQIAVKPKRRRQARQRDRGRLFERCALRQQEGRVSPRDGILGEGPMGGEHLMEGGDSVVASELYDTLSDGLDVAGNIVARIGGRQPKTGLAIFWVGARDNNSDKNLARAGNRNRAVDDFDTGSLMRR